MLSYQFWKFLEQTKDIFALELVLGIIIGGWIRQLEVFKGNAAKDVSLVIFRNFHNISFSNVFKCVINQMTSL